MFGRILRPTIILPEPPEVSDAVVLKSQAVEEAEVLKLMQLVGKPDRGILHGGTIGRPRPIATTPCYATCNALI